MSGMKFLKNWTIDIEKIPNYVEFNNEFIDDIDKTLAELILKTDNPLITDEMKQDFKKMVERVTGNVLPVKYAPRYKLGRRYPDCPAEKYPNGFLNKDFNKYYSGLIAQPRIIKNTIFKFNDFVDIDQVKGHPTIVYEMACRNNIPLPSYERYLKPGEFNIIVDEFIKHHTPDGETICLTKKDIKWLFNKTIYGGGFKKWGEDIMSGKFKNENGVVVCVKEPIEIINTDNPHPFYNEFLKDTRKIIDLIYLSNTAISEIVCKDVTDEWRRKNRVMSYFCGIIENEVTFKAYKYLVDNNFIQRRRCSWGYDGLTFKRWGDVTEVLNDLNDFVRKNTGFKTISFIEKPFEEHEILHDLIEQRNNYVVAEMICPIIDDCETHTSHETSSVCSDDSNDNEFESVATEFELIHAKIINKSVFIKQLPDRTFIVFSEKALRTAYSHLVCDEWVETKGGGFYKTTGFISKWLNENPSQRKYDDFVNKPYCGSIDTITPDTLFNIWSPFDGEFIKQHPFIWKQEGLNTILHHISILCNHQQEVTDYFIKWVGQMIQYPQTKSICPTLISNEGAGKGTLLLLIRRMLGNSKVLETTTPSRDVWGQFNNSMANSFLVVLNELTKKDTSDAEGIIKGLITDSRITINTKGVSSYEVDSYHRFIITTNKEDPITSKKDDRRNLIIRSSDEKCGDKEYFNELYKLLADDDVVKTCYEYFKNIPDLDKFNKIPLPFTEYQSDIKEASASPLEMFLQDYAIQNIDYIDSYGVAIKKETGDDLYKKFTKYIEQNRISYVVSNVQFGVRLKRLNINGVDKQHTKKGVVYLFDIGRMKKYFNLGLLIDIKMGNDNGDDVIKEDEIEEEDM